MVIESEAHERPHVNNEKLVIDALQQTKDTLRHEWLINLDSILVKSNAKANYKFTNQSTKYFIFDIRTKKVSRSKCTSSYEFSIGHVFVNPQIFIIAFVICLLVSHLLPPT